MINFDQILQNFPKTLWHQRRALLREYLQYQMLKAIFESKYAEKLSFIGGTALHICYGNKRFSEDLDFDNFGLTKDEFVKLTEIVKKQLELDGFVVELKQVFKGAFRCYFKIPEILNSFGMSPMKKEKIILQIDTTEQDYPVQCDYYTLNSMGVYQDIRVHPTDIIFSQKLITILERKRLKGRDLYDVSFLSGISKPNNEYLIYKKGVAFKKIQKQILTYLSDKNMKSLARDLLPFLYEPREVDRVENFIRDFAKL